MSEMSCQMALVILVVSNSAESELVLLNCLQLYHSLPVSTTESVGNSSSHALAAHTDSM